MWRPCLADSSSAGLPDLSSAQCSIEASISNYVFLRVFCFLIYVKTMTRVLNEIIGVLNDFLVLKWLFKKQNIFVFLIINLLEL